MSKYNERKWDYKFGQKPHKRGSSLHSVAHNHASDTPVEWAQYGSEMRPVVCPLLGVRGNLDPQAGMLLYIDTLEAFIKESAPTGALLKIHRGLLTSLALGNMKRSTDG